MHLATPQGKKNVSPNHTTFTTVGDFLSKRILAANGKLEIIRLCYKCPLLYSRQAGNFYVTMASSILFENLGIECKL
jgi:hypothetical protein